MYFLESIFGLVLLFLGGELLVKNSVKIANRLKLSKLVVGIVIIGFGTSAPELVVSIQAAIDNHPDLVTGNVVGSNIANILLILGMSSCISPIYLQGEIILKKTIVIFLSSIMLIGLAFLGNISQFTGMLLLTFLILYLFFSCKKSKSEEVISQFEKKENQDIINSPLYRNIFLAITGIILLSYGAKLLVTGSIKIAIYFGISEANIGLTLISIGTSLPEIATAISASIRKQTDVIIGNVLGSNLFNSFGILGATSIIHPLTIPSEISFSIYLYFIISIIFLCLVLYVNKIKRIPGILLIATYTAYIIKLFK